MTSIQTQTQTQTSIGQSKVARPLHRGLLPAEILRVAGQQHGALSGVQVRAALTERALRAALGRGDLVRLWHGSYAVPPPQVPTSQVPTSQEGPAGRPEPAPAPLSPVLTRLTAAELTLERPVIACLHTAAELYGFAIDPDSRTHVIGTTLSLRAELAVHRTPPLDPTNRAHGFEVVGAAETAVRLAALAANPPRSLAVLDAALRSMYTSSALLSETARKLQVTNVGRVRSLIEIADRRAESPPESWLRWVCHDAGLPPPVPQFWVRCPNGTWYRLDLAWPSIKFGLEYDGVGVHTGGALTRDRKRLGALTRAGWTIQSVTAPMLWAGRAELVAEIRADLLSRGAL